MNFKSKNLILIIGNGFDLAHNFKTSYNDFANHIIEKKLTPTIINSNHSDYVGTLVTKNFISEVNQNMYYNKDGNFIQRITYYKIKNSDSGISEALKLFTSDIKNIITNNFLGKLFDNKYKNWFDIENAYFSELISIEEKTFRKTPKEEEEEEEELKTLNNNLVEIKKILFEYLKSIKTTQNRFVKSFFKSKQFESLENVYVINFNYTITIEHYIESSENVKINYIHGDIESDNIIFGYGNDQHPKYIRIKESGIDEYLRFFKTFEYLNNRQYSEIYDNALEVFNDYDVSIMGHSLGQTDKTLLKEILDNEKCKRIHLYKRKDLNTDLINLKEEFNKLVFAVSRVIDNERDLRVKVLNFEDSKYFP